MPCRPGCRSRLRTSAAPAARASDAAVLGRPRPLRPEPRPQTRRHAVHDVQPRPRRHVTPRLHDHPWLLRARGTSPFTTTATALPARATLATDGSSRWRGPARRAPPRTFTTSGCRHCRPGRRGRQAGKRETRARAQTSHRPSSRRHRAGELTWPSGQMGRRARAPGGPASQGPAARRPPRPGPRSLAPRLAYTTAPLPRPTNTRAPEPSASHEHRRPATTPRPVPARARPPGSSVARHRAGPRGR
jgi:hypothetical protein